MKCPTTARRTFGSLFTGIGGLDRGLEQAGWTCRWQVEIDPYCQAVLARHWPDVTRYGDITQLTGEELEPVDLLCGGFPCQPVSNAGRRRAQADARWLWPHFARILRLVRPQLVLVENVPGLLNRGMGDVLGDLAKIGFDAEWQSLPAAAFGAPHIRERVWIIAYPHGLGRPVWPQPHGHPAQSQGRPPRRDHPGLALREGLSWPVEPGVDRVAYGVPHRVDRVRALGNSNPPQITTWIGRLLIKALCGCELTNYDLEGDV